MNETFMKEAIAQALKSKKDIPVGCVIVKDGQILAKAHNKRENLNLVSAHAEILALNQASKLLNNWRLLNCDMYVTLEPCPMCAWAIINSRIENLFFGAYDYKYGAMGSKINLISLHNTKINVKGGIMEENCEKIIKDYFRTVRN